MTLNIISVIIYKSPLYPPTPLKTKAMFSPPTLAMGPFLYLMINMISPPWFSFMGSEMTMVFICHEYDVGGEMEGNETKDNGLVVVGGLNDALVI